MPPGDIQVLCHGILGVIWSLPTSQSCLPPLALLWNFLSALELNPRSHTNLCHSQSSTSLPCNS